MEMRSAWTTEEQDRESLRELGELLDAADAHVLSMEAARYEQTRLLAKQLVRQYAGYPQLESWCDPAWALMDIFEEVMQEMERTSARVIEFRPRA